MLSHSTKIQILIDHMMLQTRQRLAMGQTILSFFFPFQTSSWFPCYPLHALMYRLVATSLLVDFVSSFVITSHLNDEPKLC